eukprot:10434781-Heterocapsa_arctica.AAC.1
MHSNNGSNNASINKTKQAQEVGCKGGRVRERYIRTLEKENNTVTFQGKKEGEVRLSSPTLLRCCRTVPPLLILHLAPSIRYSPEAKAMAEGERVCLPPQHRLLETGGRY